MSICQIKEMQIVATGGVGVQLEKNGNTTTMRVVNMPTGQVVTLKFDARGDLLTIGTDVVQPPGA